MLERKDILERTLFQKLSEKDSTIDVDRFIDLSSAPGELADHIRDANQTVRDKLKGISVQTTEDCLLKGETILEITLQAVSPEAIEIWNKYGQEKLKIKEDEKVLAGFLLASIGQEQRALDSERNDLPVNKSKEKEDWQTIYNAYFSLQYQSKKTVEEITNLENKIKEAISKPISLH